MTRTRSVRKSPPIPGAYIPPRLDPGTPTHPAVTRRVYRPSRTQHELPNVKYASGKVPLKYGRHLLPGEVLYTFDRPNNDEFWYVLGFCKGEANALLSLKLGTHTYPGLLNSSVDVWFYTGTAGQAVNSQLAAVDTSWNEALPGACYAVVRLKRVSYNWQQLGTSLPNFRFDLQTKKAIHPSTGLEAYSELAAVQFYDWLLHPEGKNLRRSRLNAAAWTLAESICGELVSGVARYTCHASIGGEDVDDIEKTFALMCDGIYFYSQSQFFLVLDRPATPVADYTDAHFAMEPEPDGWREDPRQRINQVVIEYTDTTNGWKVVPTRIQTDAVASGRERARPATYRMTWLHDRSVVERKLIYLLKRYNYDFKLKLRHLASTSDRQVGDVITQSVAVRAIGMQKFRIVAREKSSDSGDNTFADLLLEYNDELYSDAVSSATPKIESTLPDTSATPPDVEDYDAASITEELFETQSGAIVPRARMTWTNPEYSWLDVVELYVGISGGELRFYDEYAGSGGDAMVAPVDGVLEVGALYDFKLVVRSRYGLRSPGITASKTFAGKTTPPADVLSLTGGANGSQVFLWWQPSADRDVKSYEIRRGTIADAWETAVYDGQTNVTTWSDEPPYGGVGVRYFLKAVDAAGRYSTNAATLDITMAATGAQSTEIVWAIGPNSSTFTRVASSGSGDVNVGLWYGSGNLIAEICHPLAGEGGYAMTAMLTRTFTPAAAESERSAGSYASVGAWATAVDDPRRGGAGLWAPLPANAQGEIWGNGGVSRLQEHRARLLDISHSGDDIPRNVAIAQPLFLDDITAPAVKHYGHAFLASALNTVRGIGLRLSSNVYNYQQIVRNALSGATRGTMIVSKRKRPVTFSTGVATTDGSGLVTITYDYGADLAPGSAWLTVRAVPAGSAFATVVVDHVSPSAQTVRFKSYDASGGAAAGITFGYELTDNCGSTALVWP